MIRPESDWEREARESILKNRVIYSLPARSGYWIDDQAQVDRNQYIYEYKKEYCQLLIQKVRKMFRNLLKPTTLAIYDPKIHYRRLYLIKHYGLNTRTKSGSEIKPLYLSGVINESEIDNSQQFKHGNCLTATFNGTACIRNSFVFVDCNDRERLGTVNYGEDFFIQITESECLPLFVQCENSTMDSFGTSLYLRLTQSPDIYCKFKIFHWKPQLRGTTIGMPVDHDSFVIVQHSASGRNLAVEFSKLARTFFGTERQVSCETYKDTHRMETTENIWKIIGQQMEDNNIQKNTRSTG